MNQADVARMMADMNRLSGRVKTEAETGYGVNRSGESHLTLREVTINDLLHSLARWQDTLETALSKGEVKL